MNHHITFHEPTGKAPQEVVGDSKLRWHETLENHEAPLPPRHVAVLSMTHQTPGEEQRSVGPKLWCTRSPDFPLIGGIAKGLTRRHETPGRNRVFTSANAWRSIRRTERHG